MPYSTPTTITTGQLVTASLMNTDWAGNITFLANPPACRAYNSTNLSLNDAADTLVTFDSERFDTDTMHDLASNTGRLTIRTAGVYVLTFTGAIAAGTDYLDVRCWFRLNGATRIGFGTMSPMSTNVENMYLSATTIYKLAVNDYVEVMVHQNNSLNTARNLLVLGNSSPEFAAAWVGLG